MAYDHLPPCPSCKKDTLALVQSGGHVHVKCVTCGLLGPYGSTAEEAIELWKSLPRSTLRGVVTIPFEDSREKEIIDNLVKDMRSRLVEDEYIITRNDMLDIFDLFIDTFEDMREQREWLATMLCLCFEDANCYANVKRMFHGKPEITTVIEAAMMAVEQEKYR